MDPGSALDQAREGFSRRAGCPHRLKAGPGVAGSPLSAPSELPEWLPLAPMARSPSAFTARHGLVVASELWGIERPSLAFPASIGDALLAAGELVGRALHCVGGDDLKTPTMGVASILCREPAGENHAVGDVLVRYLGRAGGRDLPLDLRRLDHPLVLWYPSAGRDFRPLVFTTPSYQSRLSARIGEPLQLPEPELFVYTCLDKEYEPWHETRFCTKTTEPSSSAGPRRRCVWTVRLCLGQMIDAGSVWDRSEASR